MVSRNQPRSIVASRAKVAPFALCLLGSSVPKPLLPAQALWFLCESAGFVIVVGTVFIVVVIFWYDILVTIWCAVPFQNFVVIPDVLQVCELWFQLVNRCLIVFFLLFQPVVFCRQLFQRRYLSIER